MKSLRPYVDCIMIFCLSMLAFTYGLFDRELIGFETRFGVFVQEMFRNGVTIFPTTYNLPYPDYPALQTFLIYLVSLPIGKLTVLSAILPSAIASAVTLVLLYLLLAKHDRVWAYAAVFMTLLSYQFLDSARSLTMDTFVMLVTLWAFFSIHSTRRINWVLWLALITGFAIRGPIGLVMPAAVVGISLWSAYRFKRALQFGLKAIILLAGLMSLLLVAAKHQGGSAFVSDVLRMEIFGRMNDHDQRHETFDYFTMSFANYALSFEMALLTLLLFARSIFQASTPALQLLRQCALWILIIMIGMSIPNVRKIRYIMPIVPALAILASYFWYQTKLNKKKIRIVTGINYFFLVLPFICLTLIATLERIAQQKALNINVHYISAYILLGLLALASIYVLLNHPKKFGLAHPLRVMLIAVASFWVVLVFVITPIEVSLNRAKPFVSQLLQQLPTNKELVLFKMNPDGVAIQLMLVANPATAPIFARSIHWKHDKHYWFLTSQDTFDSRNDAFKQRVEIVQTGKLGHKSMIVFQLRQ
ncbi:MAG: hypothetical protein KBD83_02725 [Gammaproteobacteria bacterium]|nr:hypothetical protein [Gammaproteobacteria bacterium]